MRYNLKIVLIDLVILSSLGEASAACERVTVSLGQDLKDSGILIDEDLDGLDFSKRVINLDRSFNISACNLNILFDGNAIKIKGNKIIDVMKAVLGNRKYIEIPMISRKFSEDGVDLNAKIQLSYSIYDNAFEDLLYPFKDKALELFSDDAIGYRINDETKYHAYFYKEEYHPFTLPTKTNYIEFVAFTKNEGGFKKVSFDFLENSVTIYKNIK
ncbi:hypothetical protein [Deinococcus koreensis]|uniref:hypothetical protein n=1 Tax=Deinococcus koreensis TaxID=2054903 RepID=UPI001056F5CA|nr:hypothetical protein [Deinococcus koreensis]